MFRVMLLAAVAASFLSGCASSHFKERQKLRDKNAQAAGLYCEFISGDVYPDVDVELNLKMANRCDSDRPFSVTNYRNSSNENGVLYCCALQESKRAAAAPAARRSQPKEAASSSEMPAATDGGGALPNN